MARVYLGKLWNIAEGETPLTAQKGTIQWVSSIGGFILPETGEDVPADELDPSGCYRPNAGPPRHLWSEVP
jgi:hypothetical protein